MRAALRTIEAQDEGTVTDSGSHMLRGHKVAIVFVLEQKGRPNRLNTPLSMGAS